MKAVKTAWFCNSCGAESPKWSGRCPACGEWNTMVEEKIRPEKKSRTLGPSSCSRISSPVPVSEIASDEEPRIKMPSSELNRVLGGGLVPGSIILIGGEPGIGKSTLVLQNILSIKSRTILYVSGEESAKQIKMRADRIGRPSENVFIVCETSLQNIEEHISNIQPGLVIIDSIQTIASDDLESVAGSVSRLDSVLPEPDINCR